CCGFERMFELGPYYHRPHEALLPKPYPNRSRLVAAARSLPRLEAVVRMVGRHVRNCLVSLDGSPSAKSSSPARMVGTCSTSLAVARTPAASLHPLCSASIEAAGVRAT